MKIALETMIRRATECSSDCLLEPQCDGQGTIDVAAVVSDLLEDLGGKRLSEKECAKLNSSTKDANAQAHAQKRNELKLIVIAAWIGAASEWAEIPSRAEKLQTLLMGGLTQLGAIVSAEHCLEQPDRREELVRIVFRAFGVDPANESAKEAADRMSSLDSVLRQRVLDESREQAKRAKALREAMEKKQAAEAAARWGGE